MTSIFVNGGAKSNDICVSTVRDVSMTHLHLLFVCYFYCITDSVPFSREATSGLT
jgi:hypothetical protein